MTSQTSELVERAQALWHADQLRSLAHQHRKIKQDGLSSIFDGAATLLERLSSSEVTEEEVLDEFADVLSDEWADRDKSIYRCVERTLERTGYRIMRSAATSERKG